MGKIRTGPLPKKASAYYSLLNIERLLKFDRSILRQVASHAGNYYKPYDREQVKSDGSRKWRHIDNPNKDLKKIQKRIYTSILKKEMLLLPDGIVGGIAGKSTKDNVLPHVKREMVVTIDIKDCFPNTNHKAVFAAFREMGCGKKIAPLFTQLTTFQRRLPQGAPTSNAICNLCLLPLFNEIKAFADKNSIFFTLYVDDITLSGNYADVVKALPVVISLIKKYGYSVRKKKIRKMPANSPQKVTGALVNKKVNVAHETIEEIRSKIILIARRGNGITATEYNSIAGKINYVKGFSKEKGEKLGEFAEMLLPENIYASTAEPDFAVRKCRHHKRD